VSQPVDDSKPVQLTADEVEFESGRNVYVARGHVVIDDEDQRLTADWVSFNPDTRKGIASGNVVISEGDDVLYADFVHFDVDTLEGVVFDGFLESGDSRFELSGEEIRRTGELTYEFKRGVFSTCRCPEEGRRPWQIRAGEADLEIEGYGTTRNTTFDVLGVPVLWFPWMIYPLKTERETGLLFPELNGSSRSGGDIGVPFFWAARHNVNVTVTPRWLWKRGFKGDLNVEYLLGERSWGDFYATFLPSDHDVHSGNAKTPYSDTRWAFEWIHDQFLPADWRFKFDGRAFSDNRFSFDFQDFSQFRDDRYLESLTFLQAPNWSPGPLEGLGFLSLVRWADDQQRCSPLCRPRPSGSRACPSCRPSMATTPTTSRAGTSSTATPCSRTGARVGSWATGSLQTPASTRSPTARSATTRARRSPAMRTRTTSSSFPGPRRTACSRTASPSWTAAVAGT
jgi:lipopolysaccharide assembly outer membrane protein LptD (OstA)